MTPRNEAFSFEHSDLAAKLKAADPDVRKYVIALRAENARLHKRIIIVEAHNVFALKRIAAIEEKIGSDHAAKLKNRVSS